MTVHDAAPKGCALSPDESFSDAQILLMRFMPSVWSKYLALDKERILRGA